MELRKISFQEFRAGILGPPHSELTVDEILQRPKNYEPFSKTSSDMLELKVSGWAFGTKNPIVQLLIRDSKGGVLSDLRQFMPRPDVKNFFEKRGYLTVPQATGFEVKAKLALSEIYQVNLVLIDSQGREHLIKPDKAAKGNEYFEIAIETVEGKFVPGVGDRLKAWVFILNNFIISNLVFFVLLAIIFLPFSFRYSPMTLRYKLCVAAVLIFGLACFFWLLVGFKFSNPNHPRNFLCLSFLYPVLGLMLVGKSWLILENALKIRPAGTPVPALFQPQRYFVWASLVFGLGVVFLMPPLQAADEAAHFYKAYPISEGTLGRGTFPIGLAKLADHFEHLPFQKKNKTSLKEIVNAINIPLEEDQRPKSHNLGYVPLVYFPPAAGIFLARHFILPPLLMVYLGRLTGLLAYILLTSLAIKWIPVHKWVLCLVGLLPMSLAQGSAITADSVTIALAYLVTAYFLRLIYEAGTIRWREVLFLVALSLSLALSKNIYFVISFLCLLIPGRRFVNKVHYYSVLILVPALNTFASVGWLLFNKKLGPLLNNIPANSSLVRNDPLEFIVILGRTFYKHGPDYLEQMVGRLGWLDTPLAGALPFFYLFILVTVALLDVKKTIRISLQSKAVFLAILLSGCLLVTLALFVSWTPAGSLTILGIQGRYFLPLLPITLLLFYPNRMLRLDWDANRLYFIAVPASLLGLSTTLAYIYLRYYFT